MTSNLMDGDNILRRKATCAMIDLVCQTSPLQAALRDEGRVHDKLFGSFQVARDQEERKRLSDELTQSHERLGKLIELVEFPTQTDESER